MILKRQFALVPLFLALTACGGSGGSKSPDKASSSLSSSSSLPASSSSVESSTSSSVAVLYGQLIDSISNLRYSTATQSGTTSTTGQFAYQAGETVTFSLGDLSFTPVAAGALITPLELADTDDINAPAVVNIARLLQSLDSDNDPSNGITITDAARDAVPNLNINLPVDEFATQDGIEALLSTIDRVQLVTPDSALAHLRDALGLPPESSSASSASSESSSSSSEAVSSPASSTASSIVSSNSSAPIIVPVSSSSVASSAPVSSSSIASSAPVSSSSVASSAPVSSSSVASSAPESSSSISSSESSSSVVSSVPESSSSVSSSESSSSVASSEPESSSSVSSSESSSSVASSEPESSSSESSSESSSSSSAASSESESSSSESSSESSSSSSESSSESSSSSLVSSSESSSSSSVPSYSYTFPTGSGTEVLSHGRHSPYVATDEGPVVVAVFDENFDIVAVQAPLSQNLRKYNDTNSRTGYSPNHVMAASTYKIEQRLNQVFIWLANESSSANGSSLIGKNLYDSSIQYVGLWDGGNTVTFDRDAVTAFFDAAANLGLDVTETTGQSVTKAKGSLFKIYNDRIDEIRKDHNASNATVAHFTSLAEKILTGSDTMTSASFFNNEVENLTLHEFTNHPTKGLGFRTITNDPSADTALDAWKFYQWSGFMNNTRKVTTEHIQIIYMTLVENVLVSNAPSFRASYSSGTLNLHNADIQTANTNGTHFGIHLYGSVSLEGRNVKEFASAYFGNVFASKIDSTAVFTTQNGEAPALLLGDMQYKIPVTQTPLAGHHWAMFPFSAPNDNGKCEEHGYYSTQVNFDGNCSAAPGWYQDGGQKTQVSFVDTLGQSTRYAYSSDHRWFKIGFGANGSVNPRVEGNTVGGANRYGMDYYTKSITNSWQELTSGTHYSTGQSIHLNNSKVVKFIDTSRQALGFAPYHDYVSYVQGNVIRVGKRFAYGNTVNNTESSKYYLNDAAYQQIASYLSN
jgi:hypothetical protein